MPCPMLLPRDTRFFFLVGCMKSGTTWLMNVLDHHPDIVCRGEMHPLEKLDSAFVPPPTLETVAQHAAALRQWYFMPNNGWNEPYRDSIAQTKASLALDADYVRFFFEWTILRYLQRTDKSCPRFVGDKSPSHTSFTARKINRYFGKYQPFVVHIVRDARDVAVSRWFHLRRMQYEGKFEFAPPFESAGDGAACNRLFEHAEEPWPEDEPFFHYLPFLHTVLREWVVVNEVLAFEGPILFGPRYVQIRYEDMKRNFAESVGSLLDCFGLDNSRSMVESMQLATDVERGAIRPAVYREGKSGSWRRYFQHDDLEVFEKVAGQVNRTFGYE
ncbi:MAG: sulfotransferase [Planctomycetes bacterium]|nr:sulfotransferase [Planctomycetota bacterium]